MTNTSAYELYFTPAILENYYAIDILQSKTRTQSRWPGCSLAKAASSMHK